MQKYESIFIARQDLSASQVETLTKGFSKIIKDGKGKVQKVEPWGLRQLAYPIKKNKKGHYVLLNIESPADALHEMERNMRLSEDILRFLTIKTDEFSKEPSKVLQTKSSYSSDYEKAESAAKETVNEKQFS